MRIPRSTILFFGMFAAFSCNMRQEHVINDLLLTSSAKEIYSADELEKLSPQKMNNLLSPDFNPKTDTIKYLKDKIYVSCLIAAPGCAEYLSDITLNGDTIQMQLVNKGDVVCSELTVWRIKCEIINNQNKRYVFQK